MVDVIIKKRKSIRNYCNKEIDSNIVYDFLEVARFAPSGKNRQPWRVKILNNRDKKELIKLFDNKYSDKLPGSSPISLKAIKESSITLLFFNPYSYVEKEYSRNKMLMDTQSIGAFIQNFLLLATEKGFSTLWINDIFYVKEEIEKKFGYGNLEIVAAVTLGISSKNKTYNIRKDVNEILI